MSREPRPDRPLVAGNWKMNGTPESARRLVAALAGLLPPEPDAEVLVLPPFTALETVRSALGGDRRVRLGAQNCYWEPRGAFTGEVSAAMLEPLCDYILVGHSERRHIMGESDEMVRRKLEAVLAAGLLPILAVGETGAEREAGATDQVLRRQTGAGLAGLGELQLARCTIAYEPVWAIGTGATATPGDATAAAAVIHEVVGEVAAAAGPVRVLYGGSVTAANARPLLHAAGIRGALVGGASLRADEFSAIVAAAA